MTEMKDKIKTIDKMLGMFIEVEDLVTKEDTIVRKEKEKNNIDIRILVDSKVKKCLEVVIEEDKDMKKEGMGQTNFIIIREIGRGDNNYQNKRRINSFF